MAPNRNDVVYGLTAGGAKVALKVDADGVLQSSATLSGDVTAGTEYTEGATDATITGGVVMWEDTGDTIRAVSAAKPLPVAIISSAAGGDASAAKQDTGNATLAAIDGHVDGLEASAASIDIKTPALGQAVAGSSVPVVLPTAQITTLTPPAAITGFATAANQTTELSSLSAIDGHVDGIEGLLGTTNSSLSTIDGHVDGLETSVASIDTKTPALGQAVAGSSVPVVLPSAQITTLTPPAAITGFATSAKQDTGNTSIASIDTKTPALGQAVAGGSVPVVLPATQITTLTPPAAITGFATETTLAAQSAKLPAALGQATMAASLAVAIASNQASIPVTVALPTVVYNGVTNVTTAGTRVVLASSQAILSGVTIKAKAANTGTIYVGSSAVSSANGYALAPGDSVFLEIANLNTVNIDSSVNGEGVTFVAT